MATCSSPQVVDLGLRGIGGPAHKDGVAWWWDRNGMQLRFVLNIIHYARYLG